MAFISMVFGAIFVLVIILGLFMLVAGFILDLVWIAKNHAQEEVSGALKFLAVSFTVLGLLQGIGPILFVWIMTITNK